MSPQLLSFLAIVLVEVAVSIVLVLRRSTFLSAVLVLGAVFLVTRTLLPGLLHGPLLPPSGCGPSTCVQAPVSLISRPGVVPVPGCINPSNPQSEGVSSCPQY